MTMPGDGLLWADGTSLLGGNLTQSILNTTIPLSRLNDMVLRIVASWYQLSQDSPTFLPPQQKPLFSSWFRTAFGLTYPGSGDSTAGISEQNFFTDPRGPDSGIEHSRIARSIAAEAIVLLKNTNNTLPMASNWPGRFRPAYKEIAIFGSDAGQFVNGPNGCADRACNNGTLGQGWGSGSAEYAYLVSPLEAIQHRAVQDGSTVTFILEDDVTGRVNYTASFVGNRGNNGICLVFVSADSGEGYISVGDNLGDRADLNLWHGGDELILAVAHRCPNTVVVIHSVGPVLMEKWADHPNVTAILLASLPGQESGSSLTDVLYGDINPSGHLPYTIGKSLSDYGPGADILRQPNWEVPQVNFDEGVLVDYRWFDKHNVTPRYEFGFGGSYTNFTFFSLQISRVLAGPFPEKMPAPPPLPTGVPEVPITDLPKQEDVMFPAGWKRVRNFVYPYLFNTTSDTDTTTPYPYPKGYTDTPHNYTSLPTSSGGFQGGNPALWDPIFRITVLVTNTGPVTGKVAAQLYLSFPKDMEGAYETAVRQLRGFEKVELRSGEARVVEFVVTRRDVSLWDEGRGGWVVPRRKGGKGVGAYEVFVGGSSRGVGVTGATEEIAE